MAGAYQAHLKASLERPWLVPVHELFHHLQQRGSLGVGHHIICKDTPWSERNSDQAKPRETRMFHPRCKAGSDHGSRQIASMRAPANLMLPDLVSPSSHSSLAGTSGGWKGSVSWPSMRSMGPSCMPMASPAGDVALQHIAHRKTHPARPPNTPHILKHSRRQHCTI